MIKCFIIDDEQDAVEVIKLFIKRTPNLELIGSTTDPVEGVELIRKELPDAVFLDIQMSKMDGIEVQKNIHSLTKIIFCTAYPEFAVQSYDLDVVDYLMKPIKFARFARAIQRLECAIHSHPHSFEEAIPNDYIFVRSGHRDKLFKVNLDDVVFIEGLDHYAAFHTLDGKKTGYISLRKLEEDLPASQFMRIHKSYIVSLRHISSVDHWDVVFKINPTRIRIGAVYRDAFLKRAKIS